MMNEHDAGPGERARPAGSDGGPQAPAAADVAPIKGDTTPVATVATAGSTSGGDDDDDDHARAVRRWRNQSTKRNQKAKRPFWIELPILIVVAFSLTFLIQTFVAKVYYVPSGSMEQTLHGVQSGGDRILANKIVYDFRAPRQGDVVVFKGPDTWTPEVTISAPETWIGKAGAALGSVIGIAPPNEKDFVKRVIAVGGQTVQCCDKRGNIVVDGRSLNEPYIYEPWPFTPGVADCGAGGGDDTSYGSQRCFAPVKVPAGQLWVMGDHRSDSNDSSYQCLRLKAPPPTCARPIPADDVIGKAVFIVMPPSRWRTIGNPDIDPAATALASGPATAVPLTGGLLLTAGLRGSLAMVPGRRRRRRQRRIIGAQGAQPGGRRRP